MKLNIAYPIDNNSSIITNLNDYIIPYFKEYIELLVTELKDLIDVYLKKLHQQYVYINMINMFVQYKSRKLM